MDLPDLTPFQAVRNIASGGTGSVFLALSDQGQVAVKTLYAETLEGDGLAKFLEISNILAKLDHPNIATVLNSGLLKNGQPFVAMEYLDGHDLSHLLVEAGALAYTSVVQITHQCCLGLGAAHAAGMIHLDLKPSNIFICSEGQRVKLVDFGMARWVKNPLDGEAPVVGTPEYWSPEQASGADLDARSDLYSLGVIMFEALCGRLPFVSHSFSEVISSHLHAMPPSIAAPAGFPAIPEDVKGMVLRCLRKEPAERFASAEELAGVLADLARRHGAGRDRPPTPPASPRVSARPRPGSRPPISKTTTRAPSQPPASGEPEPDELGTSGVRPPGTLLGAYRLLELLGEGGMGRVYLAEHVRLGRKVAIKLLRSEYARNPNAARRFFTEARAVNQINHEHIVEITDFIEDGEEKYYVMELLRGETLEDALRKDQVLPVPRVLSIAIQVCKALCAVHRTGIVHRDLKPSNIFLTEMWGQRDVVKLLDFGVVKLAPEAGIPMSTTSAGAIVGTPEYMSPEQAAAKPIDHRSDLCSLGIVLFEMLAGRKPFSAKSYGELLIKIMTVEPPRLKKISRVRIPARLEELIARCLEKDPGRRPAGAEEVLAELEAIAVEEGAELEQFLPNQVTFAPKRPTRLPRRRVAAAAAAIGVLLAGGSVVAFLFLRGGAKNTAPQPVRSAVEVAIDSSPQGAEVYSSRGQRLGVTPVKLFVPRDSPAETFELRRVGYLSARRSVSFARDVQLVATLQAKPVTPTPTLEPKPASPKPASAKKVAVSPEKKVRRPTKQGGTTGQLKGGTIDPFATP